MAGPQGLIQYQPTPGTDEWAANLRAGQAVAAQAPKYNLDPSLAAARDAAQLGIANAQGVGQTIGAGAAGVGKIVGAVGDLAADYGSAVMGAIKGFGSDIATGFRGAPVQPAKTGGASGDWEGPIAPAVSNTTPKVSLGGANFAPPGIDQGVGMAPSQRSAGAGAGRSVAGVATPAMAEPEFTPVQTIRGSRVGYEYTVEDQERMRAAGISAGAGGPGRAGGFGLSNPAETINTAFDRQMASNQMMLDRAIEYVQGGGSIFEQATRNKLMAPLISSIINNNNQGQVQGQGANTMNQVAGGIQSAGIGAGASMYGSNLGLQGQQESIQQRRDEAESGSVPMGTVIGENSLGIPMPLTTYGQRGKPGGMPSAYQQPKQQFVPGTEYTSNGKRAVYQKDGTFKPVN